MIWYWLIKAIRYLAYLFGKPNLSKLAFIDTNEKCPVCGHEEGELVAVEVMAGNFRGVACLHTCKVCGARVIDEPVQKRNDVMAAAKASGIVDPAFLTRAVTSRGESIERMKQGQQSM